MTHAPLWPQAIFGGPLSGTSPLRYIYVDEAGTSAKEPVTVVAGIILNADLHWRSVEARVAEILAAFVPAKLRDERFIFHAKSVWGDRSLREDWQFAQRAQLLHAMMSIPREMKLAISLGIVRRDPTLFERLPDQGASFKGKFKPAQLEHCMAFGLCLTSADQYIRDYADVKEVAHVAVEHVPEMSRFLRVAIPMFKNNPHVVPIEHVRPTLSEKQTGVITQSRERRISRIVDRVHYVDKADGPLLKVADAWAFAFARFFQ